MIDTEIGCALVGYGRAFNWGRMHARWIGAVDGLRLRAVCTRSLESAARAKADFPEIETYASLGSMLERGDVELVSVLTPHDTHSAIAIECLRAGKHTLVDKPMAITVAECTRMLEEAETAGKTLAVFNNRRHDGNIRAILDVIERGLIGTVFYAEFFAGHFGPPCSADATDAWRGDRQRSGGVLYDWGGHAVDWLLDVIGSPAVRVSGRFTKLLWHDFSNDDHGRVVIEFMNGATADLTVSHLAHKSKPQWYILGTKGSIVDTAEGALAGYTRDIAGRPSGSFLLTTGTGERRVNYRESDWNTYYRDLAANISHGVAFSATGERGRSIISVLEAADVSALEGRPVEVAYP